ncbi:hypothetical protein SMICM17S_06490 [Streptomyces microflavus]
MFERIRRRKGPSEMERRHFEVWARLEGQVPPEVERTRAELLRAAEPAAQVDDSPRRSCASRATTSWTGG